MIPPCLTLSIIKYVSRVKWSNPGKEVVPSPTPRCSSYWKGSIPVALDYGPTLLFINISKYNVACQSGDIIPPFLWYKPVFCKWIVALLYNTCLKRQWLLMLLIWYLFVVFYGISTFVGYLMPNPFLYK